MLKCPKAVQLSLWNQINYRLSALLKFTTTCSRTAVNYWDVCGAQTKKSVLLYCKHKLPEILRWHEQVFKLIARRLTHRSKVTQDYSPDRTASLSSTTRLKMKRMYLEGVGVRGPSFPSRWRILVASTVCSQSSINSHRCAKPVSLLSGFSSMILIIQSTMALLYSKPPYKREKMKHV